MELPKERKNWLKIIAIIVAVIVVYQVGKRLLPDIDPQKVLEDVSGSLGSWTYLIVGVLAFLETGAFVGLVAPGETVVVLAGAVAGQGDTSVVLTIGIVWFSAFLGDTCSYLLGDRLGRDSVVKHGPRLRITPERFKQVEEYFCRHGGKTILIGRFIGLVRALAPFIAGSSGMPYRLLAPVQRPRHRACGRRCSCCSGTSPRRTSTRSLEQLRAGAARVRGDRRADRRRRSSPIRWLQRPENRARRSPRWRAAGAPQPARARAPAQPAGTLRARTG